MYEFQPEKETVTVYLECFQLLASANTIAEDTMVPTLLTVVGPKHYAFSVDSSCLLCRKTRPTRTCEGCSPNTMIWSLSLSLNVSTSTGSLGNESLTTLSVCDVRPSSVHFSQKPFAIGLCAAWPVRMRRKSC